MKREGMTRVVGQSYRRRHGKQTKTRQIRSNVNVNVLAIITPNQKINDIIKFIHRALLAYTPSSAAELGEDLHTMPMILGDDFNVNFALEEAQPLVQYLESKFSLKMNNNPKDSTTRSGTTIDSQDI